MALRWMDGFDVETSAANLAARYDTGSGTIADIQNGRTGKRATPQTNNELIKIFDNQQTWIIGVAMQPFDSSAGDVIRIYDGSTLQVYVTMNSSRQLVVKNGGGATLGTSTATLSTSAMKYVEFAVTIDNSVGSFTLQIDGVVDVSGTNVDTQNTANAYANKVVLTAGGNWKYFDDYYVLDGTGAAPWNAILGSASGGLPKVGNKAINGAGASTQWTPDTGSNYARVNETNQDGDTSYVATGNAGDIDLYALAASGVTALSRVLGVQVTAWWKLDASGSRGVAIEWRSNSTNYDGTTQTVASTSYAAFTECKTLDPNTSAQWTLAGLDALQIGQKLVS